MQRTTIGLKEDTQKRTTQDIHPNDWMKQGHQSSDPTFNQSGPEEVGIAHEGDSASDEKCDNCTVKKSKFCIKGCLGTLFHFHLCVECAGIIEQKCLEAGTIDVFRKVQLPLY